MDGLGRQGKSGVNATRSRTDLSLEPFAASLSGPVPCPSRSLSHLIVATSYFPPAHALNRTLTVLPSIRNGL